MMSSSLLSSSIEKIIDFYLPYQSNRNTNFVVKNEKILPNTSVGLQGLNRETIADIREDQIILKFIYTNFQLPKNTSNKQYSQEIKGSNIFKNNQHLSGWKVLVEDNNEEQNKITIMKFCHQDDYDFSSCTIIDILSEFNTIDDLIESFINRYQGFSIFNYKTELADKVFSNAKYSDIQNLITNINQIDTSNMTEKEIQKSITKISKIAFERGYFYKVKNTYISDDEW